MVQEISVGTLPELVRIDLNGPLRLTGAGGADVTPRGAKAGALIAVLGLSPDYRRSRRWIEGLLWSLTGRDQAGASLRQALAALRRELGADSDCLCSDRRDVWLDRDRVVVSDAHSHLPLLDGLDIRDPVFIDWLDGERAMRSGGGHEQPLEQLDVAVEGVVLRYMDRVQLAPELELLRDRIVIGLGNAITERMRGWIQSDNYAADAPDADVEMECSLAMLDGAGVGFVKLIHRATGQILLSEPVRFDDPVAEAMGADKRHFNSAPTAEKSIARMAEVMGRNRPAVQASALAEQALEQMFTFRRQGIAAAKTTLHQANDISPNGAFLAWRGLAGMFETIERLTPDPQATLMQMEADAARALELDPANPLVQSLTAVTHMVTQGDAEAAESRISKALSLNPDSATAWLARSVAQSLAGRTEEAFQCSAMARRLASGSRYAHWWDIFHCISAIASNRLIEAREAGEAAALRAPGFRAPHRHLLPLYADAGEAEKARLAAAKLANIERDFSLARLREDPDYPVRTLRNSRLIDFPLQVF